MCAMWKERGEYSVCKQGWGRRVGTRESGGGLTKTKDIHLELPKLPKSSKIRQS